MPPRAMSLTIKVPVVVHCSACTAEHEVGELPLEVRAATSPPIVDRVRLGAALPVGWKIGTLGRSRLALDAPANPSDPVPVVFCPTCGARVP